ncbi:MAG: sugar ABC transporter permease [Brevinema sp.]
MNDCKKFAQKYNLLMLCFVIIIIWSLFALLTNGGFLSSRNLSNLFRQMSIVGIMSIGMSFVIITGNVDLSVGSLLGLLGAFSALSLRSGMPLMVVVICTLLLGALLGLCNGWWHAYQGVPAFIVTLSSLLIYRGIVLFMTKGQTITVSNDLFNSIGSGYLPNFMGWILWGIFVVLMLLIEVHKKRVFIANKNKRIFTILRIVTFLSLSFLFIGVVNSYRGLPTPVFLLFILVALSYLIADSTVYGRTVYAIGGNAEAARLSGIDIKLISMLVFTVNGLVVGLASLVNTARLASAVPSTGVNSELDAIAACVIGGISLVGGMGSVLGALLGAVIIASINNGMSYLGLDSAWQGTIKGLVLLIAVWVDVSARKSS